MIGTGRRIRELWHHDGTGWKLKLKHTDPDGCGAGVQSCTWGPHAVTITGRPGLQAFRCINYYWDVPSVNACRTDSWYDVDEVAISVTGP